ncbi:MAG TPA: hypothetical protein QGF35_00370 [Dehalococcoidia bacterium]|nr:hypothetical protein [Dehalococcoidia bacterium]
MRIAVAGLPFFASRAARNLRSFGLNARYVPRPTRSPATWPQFVRRILPADTVYLIGSSAALNSPADFLSRARKRVVMHWVGTDVLSAVDDHRNGRLSDRLVSGATHWADAPWLVEELREVGILAAEHPLPIPVAFGMPAPMPTEFRVCVYIPSDPGVAHDLAATMQVVKQLPAVRFTLVGGDAVEDPPDNASVLGHVSEMGNVYGDCAALLRLVRHDGLSHSVVEALSFGRHVIWNYAMPGVRPVQGADEAVSELNRLKQEFDAGTLGVNKVGAEAVTTRYGSDTIRAELSRAFQQMPARSD